MKILTIAGANVRRLFRERSNIFFVFILPLGIILIIGSMFGSGFVTSIGVVAPADGGLGEELALALGEDDAFAIEPFTDEQSLLLAVERGTIDAGVVIAADHDAILRSGGSATVGFVARADGVGPQLQAAVASVVADQTGRIRAARTAQSETGATFDEAMEVVEGVGAGLETISVAQTSIGDSLFPATLGQFDLGASSQLILFMYLTGLTGSAALIQSRTYGVSARMLSTPTSSRTIILGEALGRFGVVLVQGVYILVVTLVVFGVNWGNPLGAVAILLAFGAVAAGTAMLMGTLFHNDQQAGGVGVMAGLGLAALGGCMVPLEFFSPTMKTVAHFTPHAWALDGFADLVRRDAGLMDVLPEVGVVLGFATVLFVVAARRFRRVLTAG